MEQNQMNYEEQTVGNYPPMVNEQWQRESKLPLISAVFSGLTLVVAIAILIITLMGTMAGPIRMGRVMGAGERFSDGEQPNFEVFENDVLP